MPLSKARGDAIGKSRDLGIGIGAAERGIETACSGVNYLVPEAPTGSHLFRWDR
jgi:hypothetical protein